MRPLRRRARLAGESPAGLVRRLLDPLAGLRRVSARSGEWPPRRAAGRAPARAGAACGAANARRRTRAARATDRGISAPGESRAGTQASAEANPPAPRTAADAGSREARAGREARTISSTIARRSRSPPRCGGPMNRRGRRHPLRRRTARRLPPSSRRPCATPPRSVRRSCSARCSNGRRTGGEICWRRCRWHGMLPRTGAPSPPGAGFPNRPAPQRIAHWRGPGLGGNRPFSGRRRNQNSRLEQLGPTVYKKCGSRAFGTASRARRRGRPSLVYALVF